LAGPSGLHFNPLHVQGARCGLQSEFALASLSRKRK
jgi:hypothetical protein